MNGEDRLFFKPKISQEMLINIGMRIQDEHKICIFNRLI